MAPNVAVPLGKTDRPRPVSRVLATDLRQRHSMPPVAEEAGVTRPVGLDHAKAPWCHPPLAKRQQIAQKGSGRIGSMQAEEPLSVPTLAAIDQGERRGAVHHQTAPSDVAHPHATHDDQQRNRPQQLQEGLGRHRSAQRFQKVAPRVAAVTALDPECDRAIRS